MNFRQNHPGYWFNLSIVFSEPFPRISIVVSTSSREWVIRGDSSGYFSPLSGDWHAVRRPHTICGQPFLRSPISLRQSSPRSSNISLPHHYWKSHKSPAMPRPRHRSSILPVFRWHPYILTQRVRNFASLLERRPIPLSLAHISRAVRLFRRERGKAVRKSK